jgi:DNA-directed RNA polymerase specialized sigma24 family protein
MRTLEGLEYEEISQRTGLSQINIRVLISKARKTLKKNIGI